MNTGITSLIQRHKKATFMEQNLHKSGLSDNRAALEYMLLRTARYNHLACHWQANAADPTHPAAHWDAEH